MGIGAVVHTFTVNLADLDRGIYEELSLRVARQASETPSNLLLRILAYCLEYEEGIAFSEGIDAKSEPAVLVRDLTMRLTDWIEVGAPDAARVHFGSKLADRTVVYTHRDPESLIATWGGKSLHKAADIRVIGFDSHFLDLAAESIERRNNLTITLTERQLYLELNGADFSSPLQEMRAR
ncbi:YaeQ family protein [Galactobacter caseinivorans]|uniref:YaeQ family protein n=1 Tax=Galactobacter caseinivorans TaxID=2676123 RepID=A0A496PHB2_9MICC|nr:YaeQ family protein [Galactobacter caseinivorans]RKW69872.1 hypothetical protein DWQ67_10365 [Galactobacter caseinivorans]